VETVELFPFWRSFLASVYFASLSNFTDLSAYSFPCVETFEKFDLFHRLYGKIWGKYEQEISRLDWSKVLQPLCFFKCFFFHLPTDDILSTAGRFLFVFFTHEGFFRR
jgi:hypothetical protein